MNHHAVNTVVVNQQIRPAAQDTEGHTLLPATRNGLGQLRQALRAHKPLGRSTQAIVRQRS
jgi:hypothetical protein